jgi:hypothetical protein
MFKTQIINDAIPNRLADELETILLTVFPWFLIDLNHRIISKENNEIIDEGFADSLCCDRGFPKSPFFNLFSVVPQIVLDKIDYQGPITISQIRPWMQMPNGSPSRKNSTHIDFPYPHLVLLQYITESDGDLFLFDRDETTVLETIEYKRNRCILFDGRYPHCGSTPNNKKRIAISYTIKLDNYLN